MQILNSNCFPFLIIACVALSAIRMPLRERKQKIVQGENVLGLTRRRVGSFKPIPFDLKLPSQKEKGNKVLNKMQVISHVDIVFYLNYMLTAMGGCSLMHIWEYLYIYQTVA